MSDDVKVSDFTLRMTNDAPCVRLTTGPRQSDSDCGLASSSSCFTLTSSTRMEHAGTLLMCDPDPSSRDLVLGFLSFVMIRLLPTVSGFPWVAPPSLADQKGGGSLH